MADERFYGGNIKFIKTDNLRDNYIKPDFSHYLSELGNNEIKRTMLKSNDIIVTIIGATLDIIGRATKINQEILPANINQNIALIRINFQKILPDYLNIYLNSFYGRHYLYYLSRQTEQVNLNCEEVGRLKVPMLSKNFQTYIETLVISAHQKLEQSKQLYQSAEAMLLEELGFDDFSLTCNNVAIKSLSESFSVSGRLDAEYYQPKYDEIIKHIKKTHHQPLKSIVTIKKSIEPGSDAYQDNGIPFVRVADLTKFGLSEPSIFLSKETYSKTLSPKKDTILLSKDGSIGIAYTIKNETDIITSSALLHLNLKMDSIHPEYLTLVLNSVFVQLQAERDAGGSIIQHWRQSEIENILIPILSIDIQRAIETNIQKSFTLRSESKQLLAKAKAAVECAIEQGEAYAINTFFHDI